MTEAQYLFWALVGVGGILIGLLAWMGRKVVSRLDSIETKASTIEAQSKSANGRTATIEAWIANQKDRVVILDIVTKLEHITDLLKKG